MTQGVRRHFCRPKFCPTVCSKSHESACNTSEFVAGPEMRPLTGRWVPGLIQTRRAFGLRNVHRRDGARRFWTAIFGATQRGDRYSGAHRFCWSAPMESGPRTNKPSPTSWIRTGACRASEMEIATVATSRPTALENPDDECRQSTMAATSQIFTCPEIKGSELRCVATGAQLLSGAIWAPSPSA